MYGQGSSSTGFFIARFVAIGLLLGCLGVMGCEIRPKPFIHTVEYRSAIFCSIERAECPWDRMEQEASFVALVNCLLSGANVLENQEERQQGWLPLRRVVAPIPPRFGYERRSISRSDSDRCSEEGSVCSVASRHDRPVTWASCGTRELDEGELRGGEDFLRADGLDHTDVVTGSLAHSTDEYSGPIGLNGPDHWYRFTISERTRIEAAVAANRALWSGIVGLVQSAWQPALYLLSSDGTRLQRGFVLRAGVTALFPSELEPGIYYLLVDSSVQEWKRGDGLYRLYVGFNQTLLGPRLDTAIPTTRRVSSGS
ncbi:MAG: hypothetical protein CV090_14075 [Nitrospira sp. WS238]|nr:hypothetical protein [Nitrospira sp. WS238]